MKVVLAIDSPGSGKPQSTSPTTCVHWMSQWTWMFTAFTIPLLKVLEVVMRPDTAKAPVMVSEVVTKG